MESIPEASTEPALDARVQQQAAVAELGRRALGGADLDELLDFAVTATASALAAPLARAIRIDDNRARVCAAVGFDDGNQREVDWAAEKNSLVGFAASIREPVLIDDLRNEKRFESDEALSRARVVSGISVAIAGTQGAWGVLGVHDTKRRSFSADDVHFVHAVANVLADAQARRRAEDQLKESEARARAVLDTTVDGIITIDPRGSIASFNRAAERIFGYKAEEVTGRNISILMPEPYHSEHDDYLRNYRETGRRKIIGIGREVTGRRKDGSTFPMDLAVSEVDLGGRVVFTGIVRDISERRRLEQEVLRVSDDERRRIGQDLHDGLGQQLTGIGLIARNLARKLQHEKHPESLTAEEITRLIQEADEQARQLARGLVPVELGPDGLSAALERLAKNAGALFGIDCALEVRVEDDRVLRHSDAATHLYRIAQEAISNAVRHGEARHVSISLNATAERLRLWIHDDGIGIPEDFASFPYANHEGMGLHIMHYRARIIGGSLDVRPSPGGGTTVVFTSPPSSDSPVFRGERTGSPVDRPAK
jgi:two-component system, LuxR family, sensor kinase FixL